MKKTLLSLTVALAFTMGGVCLSVAHADEMEDMMMNSYCPMMSLKHSKELGLSKKQEAKFQKIKDDMWAQMKPIATKSSADTEAVLTDKQKAKYKEVMSSMMGHCGCGKDKDGEHGDSCEMKKEKKD